MRRTRPIITAILLALALALLTPGSSSAEPSRARFPGRWIDVNLSSLRATAYEGDRPVYQALITTGKPGFDTIVGTYYIQYRVANETMDSLTIGVPRDAPEGYYLKNVLYTQYFTGEGDAIHSNYWQPDWVFGQANTSHGCVGMRTKDAAFFWDFATIGTPIVIHRESAGATVDHVVGQSVAEARATLIRAGFQVEVSETTSDKPSGTVLAQTPLGGSTAAKGSVIKLTVAATRDAAPAPATPVVATATPAPIAPTQPPAPSEIRKPVGNRAWVPSLIGLTEAEARKRIEEAGLLNTYTNFQVESDISAPNRAFFRTAAPGTVLSSDPPAGTEVLKGSTVRIAVKKP